MREITTGVTPIGWDDNEGQVFWLDNTALPWQHDIKTTSNPLVLMSAIKDLEIRGSAVLGEAGAYGAALAVYNSQDSYPMIQKRLTYFGGMLAAARPTAVNLRWGVEKIEEVVLKEIERGASPLEVKDAALAAAKKIQSDNIEATYKIGENGKNLIHEGDVILTICNAGTLACDGLGTATAPLRTAWAAGINFEVIATYTAPLYQGARLTAWELNRDGIPVKVITDNMAAHVMRERGITAVWAGADRILGNCSSESGTVYNKIGTFGLSLIANELGVYTYVAAPTSTIDPKSSVSDIKIEERDPEEVKVLLRGTRIVPTGVGVMNPAFDMTPPNYVSAIVTEVGVARAPYDISMPRILSHPESMVKIDPKKRVR